MPIYVYALLGSAPGSAAGEGVVREPLRVVRSGDVFAAVGDVTAVPALDPPTLRAHDAVIRRLAATSDAVLPARFGSVLPDDDTLTRLLAARSDVLAEALRLVAGREQMTLRVFGEASVETEPETDDPAVVGPGAAYLAARLSAARRAHAVPEIEWLRPILARFVVAERVERHRTKPLLASVHHLIPRGESAAYRVAIRDASEADPPVRVVLSGPWPPYAFAPDAT